MSHAITYAVFQAMFALFLASPFAGKTADGDYVSLQPKEVVRLLEQPKTAGLRYYFTLNPDKKISVVFIAIDSNGTENRNIVLNTHTRKYAETCIAAYQAAGMVDKTGTKHCTIGVSYDNVTGKITIDSGKDNLLTLAKSSHEIRAFYCLKEDSKSLQLVFASADPTGTVLMRNTSSTATLFDNAAQCPPFCRGE